MSSNCTRVGTSSALVKETASITWVLDNFPSLTGHHLSPDFSPPNNPNLVFRFGIVLKLERFSYNVLIYLNPYQTDDNLSVEYEVSILDSHNRKCFTKMFQCSYDKKYDHVYCFASLMHYRQLIKEANGFLNGNRLTLLCNVNILKTRNSNLTMQPVATGPILAKLTQNFQAMLESGDYSDFSLMVGGKVFKVHKAVLAARSEVFKAMFSADLVEKKRNRVEISDIEVEVFEQLLAYIYSGIVSQMNEYALELFVAADKYQLDELKCHCCQSLSSSLTIETVTNILLHADMHTAPQLKSNCIQFITVNSVQVMATEGWKHLLKSNRMQLMGELFADIALTKSQN